MGDSKSVVAIVVALIGLVPSMLAYLESRDAKKESQQAVIGSQDAKKAAGTESVNAASESYQETIRPALVGLTDSVTAMQRRITDLEERLDRARSTGGGASVSATPPTPKPPAPKPVVIAPDVSFRSDSLKRAAEAKRP